MAIHEVTVISSPLLVDLEEGSPGGSCSGLSCWPIQLCQGRCGGRKAGLVGRVEKAGGLKTSSDPRGSLGRGGSRDGDLENLWSAASISLDWGEQNVQLSFWDSEALMMMMLTS